MREGVMYGRGTTDMKSAPWRLLLLRLSILSAKRRRDGAVILAITGDEEGDALDGTTALLEYMEHSG